MASDLDVGMRCIKYMLFSSNFMFVMIGFVLISMGSSIKAIYWDFDVFMQSLNWYSPATLLVAIGVIIFFVSLFGCVGAVRESTCLINMYGVLLGIILILEVSAAIAAYALRNDLNYKVRDDMALVMSNYKYDSESAIAMDFLQSRLQCCGIDSYLDWIPDKDTDNDTVFNETLPTSCCIDDSCNVHFEEGCLSRLTFVISECAVLLGSGALCVAFVQLLGMIFAFLLAKAVRRIKTEKEMNRQERRQQLYTQIAQSKEEKPDLLFPTP